MEGIVEKYIDVVGESSVVERPSIHSADLRLRVVAPSNAKALEDMAELLKAVIKKLIGASGLTADQVVDGGADLWPMGGDDHMKGSKCVDQWIKLETQEKKILSRALNEIDGLFVNNNHFYFYRIRFPEFAASSAMKAKALHKAVEDAKTKAMVIANAANINLGGVVQVFEMKSPFPAPEASAPPAPEVGPTGPMREQSVRFIPVERIRPVRCRVRFAIDPAQ